MIDPVVASPTRRPSRQQLMVAARIALMPMFFAILFPLAYVSALHQPTPHGLSIVVVGPDEVVAPIVARLDERNEFTASQASTSGAARQHVADRTAQGAIDVQADPAPDGTSAPTFTVTTYIADANGKAVASAVQATGDSVARELDATAKIVDVSPLADEDPLGTTLFFLLVFTSLGSYLVVIVLAQVMPHASLVRRFAAVAITSVAAPAVVFGLSAVFVGAYGASAATIAQLLAVAALYAFTVGSAALLLEQFLGSLVTLGVMAVVVFLNFPSAGGANPGPMLPEFWQFVHGGYFGSGAFESLRSIIYFHGHGAGRWLIQLAAWALGLSVANLLAHLVRTVRVQGAQIAALSKPAQAMTTAPEGAHR